MSILTLIIGIIVSTIIIYIVTKLLGEKEGIKNGFFRCSNWFGSIWSNPHVYKWFISAYRRNRMVLCFEMALQYGLVKNNCSCSNTLGCRVNSWSNFTNRNGPILKNTPTNLFIRSKIFVYFLFI